MKPLQIIAILLIALMLLLLGFCAGHGSKHTGTKSDTVYKHSVERDTLLKRDSIKVVSKPKIIRYTEYRITHDTIQVPGVELAITDTLQGDSITSRLTEIIKQDTTFKEATHDTVWINNTVYKKPKFGFGAGFALGLAAGIAIGVIK